MNTLALRGDLSGDPSFVALLARNRSASLEAFEHQEVPFERVVAELKCPRTRDHSPIFQIMFVLQNFRRQMPRLAELEKRKWRSTPAWPSWTSHARDRGR